MFKVKRSLRRRLLFKKNDWWKLFNPVRSAQHLKINHTSKSLSELFLLVLAPWDICHQKKKKVFGSHLSLICLYDFVFKVNTIYHVLQLCGLWILSITVRKTDHVRNIKKQSRIPLSHSTLDPQSNHSWQSRPFLIRVKQIWHLHSVDVRVPLAPPHCCSANGVKFTFCLCFLPVYVCSKLYT